jgi:hypothetical protein
VYNGSIHHHQNVITAGKVLEQQQGETQTDIVSWPHTDRHIYRLSYKEKTKELSTPPYFIFAVNPPPYFIFAVMCQTRCPNFHGPNLWWAVLFLFLKE